MENRFNNRDFEQFVKQNADQYRMYPSDQVWKGIHNTLHTRRRWFGIGLGFLILTAGVVTWVMMASSNKNKNTAEPVAALRVSKTTGTPAPKELVTAAPHHRNSFITPSDNVEKKLFPVAADPGSSGAVTEEPAAFTALTTATVPVMTGKTDLPAATTETTVRMNAAMVPAVAAKNIPPAEATQVNTPVHRFSFTDQSGPATGVTVAEKESVPLFTASETYPMTIESVWNSYSHRRSRKKVSLQLFLTPTISYRKLDENKEFTNLARNSVSSAPTSTYYNYADINSVVTHKPDLGVQVGVMAGYPLSRNLTLIGGLQFNVSKYDIKAYTHPGEIATIALQNTAGGTNTVSTVTNYRNTGSGYFANWLHNLYFSASAPVGLEMKLSSGKKSYFGVSATAQPTYVIGNRAYLISTDYKNYAEVPSLTRKWNINAGFEMFAGNTTGKLRWRVGPQARYQVKSSFVNKYPVKEHLFDFGLKMGIFLSK